MRTRRDLFMAVGRILNGSTSGELLSQEAVADLRDVQKFLRKPLPEGTRPLFGPDGRRLEIHS